MKKRTYLQKKTFMVIIGAFLFLTLIGTKVDSQVLPFDNSFPRFLYFYTPPISPLTSPLLAPDQPSPAPYYLLREANAPVVLPTTFYFYTVFPPPIVLPPISSGFFPFGITAILIAALNIWP